MPLLAASNRLPFLFPMPFMQEDGSFVWSCIPDLLYIVGCMSLDSLPPAAVIRGLMV